MSDFFKDTMRGLIEAIIIEKSNTPLKHPRKEVNAMSNLPQGIIDDVMADIILNMYQHDFTLEEINVNNLVCF